MAYGVAQLDPIVQSLRGAYAQVQALLSQTGDATLRATQTKALQTIGYGVDKFAGQFRDEVIAGTRPYQRWFDYGTELMHTLSSFGADLNDFASRFSGAANALGSAAQWTVDTTNELLAKIDDAVSRVEALADQRKYFDKQREVGQTMQLSAEAREVLYGQSATNAIANYERMMTLTEGLKMLASALRRGEAFMWGDGYVQSVNQTGTSGLGLIPQLIAGVGGASAIVTITIVLSILAAVVVFFTHAKEVGPAVERLGLGVLWGGLGVAAAAGGIYAAKVWYERRRKPA